MGATWTRPDKETGPGVPVRDELPDKGRQWFAVSTRSRQEKIVGSALASLGIGYLLPMVSEERQRFHFHFTPASSSWLNMVERFFRDLTRNQLHRAAFTSVEDLQKAIFAYLEQHNSQPKPFIWTAKATDTLEGVKRGKAALLNRPSA